MRGDFRDAVLLLSACLFAWLFRLSEALPRTGDAWRDGFGDTLETMAAVGFVVCVVEWWRGVRTP